MLKTALWRSLQLAKWLLRSNSCHSVHSPLLFELCKFVFGQPKYEAQWLFKRWCSLIPEQHKSTAIKSAIYTFDAKLLLGLIRFFQPDCILEIGTGFGFSTGIFHHAMPKANIVTFEKNKDRHSIAKKIFFSLFRTKYAVQKVKFVNQPFPIDSLILNKSKPYVVFIDGGHKKQQMKLYLQWLFQNLPEKSIIIMHDIYWSDEMYRIWRSVWDYKRVTFWIDMFRLGILILDYPAQKMKISLRPGPPLFLPL